MVKMEKRFREIIAVKETNTYVDYPPRIYAV
jgi:hypothetical protein